MPTRFWIIVVLSLLAGIGALSGHYEDWLSGLIIPWSCVRITRASFRQSVVFQMQFVHDPVHERRQDERRRPDEQQAGKQRVARGEEFAGVARDRIDGAHPPEDHRCVDQGVDPRQTAQVVVPEHADGKGHADDERRQTHKPDDAPEEPVRRQQGIGPMLKHARYGI